MSADELSTSLETECRISIDPPPPLIPPQSKQCYRPKPSSLPTSLVRTILLNNNNDDGSSSNSSGGDDSKTIPTTLILQLFSDRIFLSITQLSGKMGSLLMCNVEESIIDNSTTYHVRTLLGTGVSRAGGGGAGAGGGISAEQEVSLREVCVRRLAEKMVQHARKMAGIPEGSILGGSENGEGPIPPLVLGLGLRPMRDGKGGRKMMSVEDFNKVVDAAMELYVEGWNIQAGLSSGGTWELPD